MDWLTFIAAMTGHIMWPLVIIVLLILLRKHLGVLADRIEEFSFGGAKLTWKKKLEEGAKIIEHTPTPQLPKPSEPELPLEAPAQKAPAELAATVETVQVPTTRYLQERRKRQQRSALARILSGLNDIDRLAFEIGDWYGIDAASPQAVIHMLVAIDMLPESLGQLYSTLKDARNAIAHAASLPKEAEAEEYERQVSYLKSSLEALRDAAIEARKAADKSKDGKKE